MGIDGARCLDTPIPKDLTYKSILNTVEHAWIEKFSDNLFETPDKRTTNKWDLSLVINPHLGREQLQFLINSKIAKQLKTSSETPIAHIISKSIVHANGVLDNAFAAVLCSEPTDSAFTHLHALHYPISYKPSATDEKTSEMLAIHSHETIAEVLSDKVINYLLDKKFKLQIKIQRGLTRQESAKPKTPRAATTNRPQSAPAGGRHQPKNQPAKGASTPRAGGAKKGAAAPVVGGIKKDAATPRGRKRGSGRRN